MKKNNNVYSTELSDLQELRDEESGTRRMKIQEKIDDHFFKDPPKERKKKKKRWSSEEEEDCDYY